MQILTVLTRKETQEFKYEFTLCVRIACGPTFARLHSSTSASTALHPMLSILPLAMSELMGDFPAVDLK